LPKTPFFAAEVNRQCAGQRSWRGDAQQRFSASKLRGCKSGNDNENKDE
jgi:hypothetical protein